MKRFGFSRWNWWWCSLSILALAHGAPAQTTPFVMPWNDTTPGITDFSAMNDPIGSERVTVSPAGQFRVGGKRIRFLGVNFAGDSPFMATNKAEGVAARLAKFGVNSVRFHHMDASWAYGGGLLQYTSVSSTNFRPTQLERLHYLVARLKAHGIYSDINLLVGREYRSGDGLGAEAAGMDWKDAHILGCFYEPALASQKDYATRLLGPTNPFTGLSLARDPAVAFVEIINENGVVQKWLDGGLDRLPARYAASLQSRWNDWLAARYATESALLEAWSVVDEPLGTNLLRNGAFSSGLTGWNLEQHSTARASAARSYEFTNNQPCARVQVTTTSPTSWHIQFNQAGLRLASNQVYTVSFWAKSTPGTNFDATVMRAHTDYAALGYSQTLTLTTNWQRFTATFQSAVNETNARINFGAMGNKLATFYLADVRFQAGGQVGLLPAGASLAARSIPNLRYAGTGFLGTREARRDWLRFLRDLENRYYDEMVAHIRTTLGYDGILFGTIMANSPATVQSRLDVIDGHAYWQHPEFPGQPWDSVNWYVPNVSIVNTFDNPLAGLARQRVQGKPFTVTEYQHPSPNYYGAEGVLLLAAYGGLQDWDGLWLFDYGHGNDTVTMGYVRGFFEIGQHPTKMANLLLAANLFRRGDVRPAAVEHAAGLNPDTELDLLEKAHAWGVFSSSQLGMPGKLAFASRLSTRLAPDATNPTPPAAPEGNVVTSDTGELRWDLAQAGKGLVTCDTPRTKALVGFADGKEVRLSELVFRPGPTMLGWCTLSATLKSGTSFTNSASVLVVASGWWENTGQVWKNANKDSVGNQWGGPPVLTEVVPFTLTLPVSTNAVRAWALDPTGQRKATLPVTGNAQSATVTVTTNAASLWYELEIAPTFADFDAWRQRYFTPAELGNAAVSGPAAVPDGDGVPNLWKYYLGLPGGTPADPNRLPVAGVVPVGEGLHLGFTFERDKVAAEIPCVGEVSQDLGFWNDSPTATVQQVTDLGAYDRVVVRDAEPLGGSPSRHLRLRLQWP